MLFYSSSTSVTPPIRAAENHVERRVQSTNYFRIIRKEIDLIVFYLRQSDLSFWNDSDDVN